ncbi:TIGR02281 family clan AA aspartic protease [Novosphingobium sp. 9U]|uniref:TIGR02281 family clan AA aspartic protease n=1 Tax=Novosphingobium sp. 9U TaxID=2653158 RepID=UPI0013568B48
MQQPLLALAIVSILVGTVGGMLRRPLPILGGFVRGVGNLGLVAALLLTIAQVTRFTTGNDLALPQLGLPAQSVEGGETRVPMDGDGHFWLTARLNGVEGRFLIDTGATLTAISPAIAEAAGLKPKPLPQAVMMRTANGTIQAQLTTVDELRFGNVVARDLDAVVAPGLGDANVIGMNLLSRLASWRVEGRTLILVPHHPQDGGETG